MCEQRLMSTCSSSRLYTLVHLDSCFVYIWQILWCTHNKTGIVHQPSSIQPVSSADFIHVNFNRWKIYPGIAHERNGTTTTTLTQMPCDESESQPRIQARANIHMYIIHVFASDVGTQQQRSRSGIFHCM